jgi:hypothetical protein
MEKARKAEFLPRIKATIHFAGPTFVELKAQNVGKGAAIDIDALIKTLPDGGSRKWQQPLMAPNECEFFFLPEGNFEKLAEKYDYVVVEGSFKDIFGETFPINEKIEFKEFLANIKELKKVWKEPEPLRHLKEIRDKLGDIERTLREIRLNMMPIERPDREN